MEDGETIDDVAGYLYGTMGQCAPELTEEEWNQVYEILDECPTCGYFVYKGELHEPDPDDERFQPFGEDICEFCELYG